MNFDEILEILKTGDEAALRDIQMPFPKSKEELDAIIEALMLRQHDYGTCVYAISIAAEATLNYVAAALGATGFQVSCADLDILRRTRSLTGPFALIDANDLLYPQYNIQQKVEELLTEWQPWATEQAKKLLDEERKYPVHSDVQEHWERHAAR